MALDQLGQDPFPRPIDPPPALLGHGAERRATSRVPATPGKARGLQRVLSEDGFILSLAVDHVHEFNELLDPAASFAERVTAKLDLVRTVAPVTSAVLVDAHFGLGHAVLTGVVPPETGLMVSLEDGDYSLASPKCTEFREGWDVARARAAGADAVKLLWWYRPDGDLELAASQREPLAQLVADCNSHDMLLVVEPIWFRRLHEDSADPDWRAARAAGIVEGALTAEEIGADLLKVEFPASLDDPVGEKLARETLAQLDNSLMRPWVILSAGVAFEAFARQLECACRAGASGYIAGRSLWRDVVAAPETERVAEVAVMVERLNHLAEITRTYGRPVAATHMLPVALTELPESWYR